MRFLRDVSIQQKLTWIIMLTSGVALLIACAAFALYELVSFRYAMTRELLSMAEIIGSNSTAALEFKDPKAGEEILSALRADSRIVSAHIYTEEGKVFATYQREVREGNSLPQGSQKEAPRQFMLQEKMHSFPSHPKERSGGASQLNDLDDNSMEPNMASYLEGGYLTVFRPIILDGERTGVIYIQSDLQMLYARLKRYAVIVVIVLLASSLVAFLLSSRLQRLISKPILHLAETASFVSAQKDYSIRAVKQSQDELGILIDRFNEMLAQIQERDMALEKERNLLRTLMDNLPNSYVFVKDIESRFVTTNASHLQALGAGSLEEVVGKTDFEFFPQALAEQYRADEQAVIQSGQSLLDREEPVIDHSGRSRWFLTTKVPLYDNNGSIIGVIGMSNNITDRKRAEEQIRESLKEKEVLLKEIHHRVKNNLQVISSLLYLQSKKINDEGSFQIFKESQNRIKSMALIHEKLYRSEDLAKIDFAEYIRNLTNSLFRSYEVSSSKVELKIKVDETSMGIDTAIPCGLIINELVSNSLKYAFPDGREGEINIGFHSDDGKFNLVVGDNGVGFPEELDFRNTQSLGLQLVNTLTGQLDGEIYLDKNGGTEFRITFAEIEHRKRG